MTFETKLGKLHDAVEAALVEHGRGAPVVVRAHEGTEDLPTYSFSWDSRDRGFVVTLERTKTR